MSILHKIFKKKPSALTVYKAVDKQLKGLQIANDIVGGLTDWELREIVYLRSSISKLIKQRE